MKQQEQGIFNEPLYSLLKTKVKPENFKDLGVSVTFKEPENIIIIEGFERLAKEVHQEISDLSEQLENEFIEYTVNPDQCDYLETAMYSIRFRELFPNSKVLIYSSNDYLRYKKLPT